MALVTAPVLWRSVTALRTEREGRIREQERAELAAMVHDQVLHTLALIQRNAGDPTTVLRLARGQERSLRNWLYKPTGSPTERFAAALEQAAAEVEDTYAIEVETVVVGDAETDERVARAGGRDPRGAGQRGPARRGAVPSPCTRRSEPGGSASSSATGVPGSTVQRGRCIGMACAARSSGGWSRMADRRRSGRAPGEGTEVG